MTSAPSACKMRRMMLMAASCPSNRLAAVTKRMGWVGVKAIGVWQNCFGKIENVVT